MVNRGVATLTVGLLGVFVLGCGPTASSSPSGGTPSGGTAPGGTILLQRIGPIGCDSIGINYTSATIKVDAASDPDVWAETEAGKMLTVNWTDGFTATDGAPPVIHGPEGDEVARDGTKIDVPADGSAPRLSGFYVCLGTDAINVLETDPQ